MDTKSKSKILIILIAVLLAACDPADTEKTFIIHNSTSKDMSIMLYENSGQLELQIDKNTVLEIMYYKEMGGNAFGKIARYDSISLVIPESSVLKWVKPSGVGFIEENNNVGKDRGIGKDIYNKAYWLLKAIGGNEEWSFVVNEADLELFE